MNETILIHLREELLNKGPLQNLPEEVWKHLSATNTWGTNTIEGNSLTHREVERLLLEGRAVGNRPVGDVLETLQHDRAFRGLFSRVPKAIGLVAVLEIHEDVFRGVKADAGLWRQINVRIVGAHFTPPRWEKVMGLMSDWAREYGRRAGGGDSVFAVGAWMHHRFEEIHPFSDGNGRAGRLLMNLHFLKHNWPPVSILPEHRGAYIAALESAQSGNLEPLGRLLKLLMGSSLIDLMDFVGASEDELKPVRQFAARGRYSAKYLALRASQGELPALKHRGDWRTSGRALRLYREFQGRA